MFPPLLLPFLTAEPSWDPASTLAVVDEAQDALVDGRTALQVALRVLLVVLICLVVRFLLHRAIERLTRRAIEGRDAVVKLKRRAARKSAAQPPAAVTARTDERRRQRAQTIGSVLKSVVSIAVVTIGAITVLGELSIDVGPIVASAGIVGVALGFGAQNLVKDFLNGICMILEDQYGVGDVVDLGEASGVIEEVGLRVTRLRDAEGAVWYVRNGEVLRVGNKSQGTASVIVDMPVAHGTDLAEAKRVLDEAAQAMLHDDAWKDSITAAEVQGVETVTATGITLRVVVTAVPAQRFSVGREARARLATALDIAGIRTPIVPFATGADPSATP